MNLSAKLPFVGGKPHQMNVDFWIARNARIVANSSDPFDSQEEIVVVDGRSEIRRH